MLIIILEKQVIFMKNDASMPAAKIYKQLAVLIKLIAKKVKSQG